MGPASWDEVLGEGFPGVSGLPRWYLDLFFTWPSQLVGVSGKGVMWVALVLQLFLPLGAAVAWWTMQNWREYREIAAAAGRRIHEALGRRPILLAVAVAARDIAVDFVSLPWNLVQAAMGEDAEEILAEGRLRLTKGAAAVWRVIRDLPGAIIRQKAVNAPPAPPSPPRPASMATATPRSVSRAGSAENPGGPAELPPPHHQRRAPKRRVTEL